MDTWVASRRTARLVLLSVAGPCVQGSAFCFIYAVHPGLGFVYTLERREFLWLSPRTACTWSSWTTPRTSQIKWSTQTMVRIVRLLHRTCGHGLWWLREEQPGSFTVISRFRAYDVLCLAGHIPTGPGSVVLFLMVGGSAYGSTRCASACEIFITSLALRLV